MHNLLLLPLDFELLINTLTLQEAKVRSEIENIITTHDELFQSNPQIRVNIF